MHLPFLTSNVPPTTFSTELKLEHLVPDSEMQLAQELAEYRPFNDVPVVLFSPLQACALRFTPTLHKTMGILCAVFFPISMHPSRSLKWVQSSCSQHLCGNLQNLGQCPGRGGLGGCTPPPDWPTATVEKCSFRLSLCSIHLAARGNLIQVTVELSKPQKKPSRKD